MLWDIKKIIMPEYYKYRAFNLKNPNNVKMAKPPSIAKMDKLQGAITVAMETMIVETQVMKNLLSVQVYIDSSL